ncbi:MAG: zinc ribbon domain-containing protein [Thermoplasmata archaeon]
MSEEDRPLVASVLSLIGGILIFSDGAVLSSFGAAVRATGYSRFGGLIGDLADAGLLMGILVFVLALAVYESPDAHRGLGIAILSLSLLSLLGGGGFVIGAILGSLGGILAILHVDPAPLPAPYAPVSGWSERACPACGSPLAPGAIYCHTCGQAVPPATGGAPPLPIPSADLWGRTHQRCPTCARVVPVQSTTCPGCGQKLA